MSADNTIFIRPLSDGRYGVKMMGSSFSDGRELSEKEIDEEFTGSGAQCVSTMGEAKKKAREMYQKAIVVEHGIQFWPREDQDAADPNNEVIKKAKNINLGDYTFHTQDAEFYEVIELEKRNENEVRIGIVNEKKEEHQWCQAREDKEFRVQTGESNYE